MSKLSRACALMKMYDDAINHRPIRKISIMDYVGVVNQDSFSDYKRDFRHFLVSIWKSDKYLLYVKEFDYYILKDVKYLNELKEELIVYQLNDKGSKEMKLKEYKKIFYSSKIGFDFLYQAGEISEELLIEHKEKSPIKSDTKAINCLALYHYLVENSKITRDGIMEMFNISKRSIDNIIQEIRIHLSESCSVYKLCYDAKEKCYKLIDIHIDDYKEYKYY